MSGGSVGGSADGRRVERWLASLAVVASLAVIGLVADLVGIISFVTGRSLGDLVGASPSEPSSSVPGAQSTTPSTAGGVSSVTTAASSKPAEPVEPASGKCPDDETPWTGRESAVQDRGDRIYAVRREGTSVVFEVRDRELRVLEQHQLGGNVMGTPVLGRGSQADADVWVFAVDSVTNDLVHKRARADATAWDSEWGVVEGELTSDITATSHQSWGIEVFVRGGLRANGQKTIDHATYTFATGTWAQWYYTDGSVTSAPEVVDYPDGRMTVRACSDDRTYIHYRRTAAGAWVGWRR